MSFPIHDWQFWAVTGIFAAAALWLARGFLPFPGSKRRRQRRRTTRRATLTVGGRPISK
jgi:hypothetical protein